MKVLPIIFCICIVIGHPPRLVEIAKRVNQKQHSWVADENTPLRDYSVFLGTLKNRKSLPIRSVPLLEELPKEFDSSAKWPECPSIMEIRDQSECASCWAMGVVEVATDRICIETKGEKQVSLSAEDVIECCRDCGFQCKGGYTGMAWEYLRRTGVVTGGQFNTTNWCKSYPFPPCSHGIEGSYPQCSTEPPVVPKCELECQPGYPVEYSQDRFKFSNVYQLENDVDQIKSEILTNGPVDASFQVFEDFMTYKSGIYHHVEGKFMSLHTVKIIGWGEENGEPFWKVVNSWNSEWGEKGLFRIRLGTNECTIESQVEGGLLFVVCYYTSASVKSVF